MCCLFLLHVLSLAIWLHMQLPGCGKSLAATTGVLTERFWEEKWQVARVQAFVPPRAVETHTLAHEVATQQRDRFMRISVHRTTFDIRGYDRRARCSLSLIPSSEDVACTRILGCVGCVIN